MEKDLVCHRALKSWLLGLNQQKQAYKMMNLNLPIIDTIKDLNDHEQPKTFRAKIAIWHERYKERKQLAELSSRLDDRLLSDIGISRIDAMQEYTKPFWEE